MSNYREEHVPRMAEMFKALSNPNRLKIFLRLLACCPTGPFQTIDCGTEPEACACVGELGQDLAIVPSTISHHVKELRRAGLIRVERRGQKMECSLDPEALTALRGFFS
ncbi:MAG: helix-turn-helix domain-containing protein [Proteobacteria bacterium]|nr:helix-turn-helix domain-containing protein [Pseudomonadota bacterium]MBU1742936.1 helix-turn-helix domain-containing protein [Pseudomonadota bacterium]